MAESSCERFISREAGFVIRTSENQSGLDSFFHGSTNSDLLVFLPQKDNQPCIYTSLGMESRTMRGRPESDFKLYLDNTKGYINNTERLGA